METIRSSKMSTQQVEPKPNKEKTMATVLGTDEPLGQWIVDAYERQGKGMEKIKQRKRYQEEWAKVGNTVACHLQCGEHFNGTLGRKMKNVWKALVKLAKKQAEERRKEERHV